MSNFLASKLFKLYDPKQPCRLCSEALTSTENCPFHNYNLCSSEEPILRAFSTLILSSLSSRSTNESYINFFFLYRVLSCSSSSSLLIFFHLSLPSTLSFSPFFSNRFYNQLFFSISSNNSSRISPVAIIVGFGIRHVQPSLPHRFFLIRHSPINAPQHESHNST